MPEGAPERVGPRGERGAESARLEAAPWDGGPSSGRSLGLLEPSALFRTPSAGASSEGPEERSRALPAAGESHRRPGPRKRGTQRLDPVAGKGPWHRLGPPPGRRGRLCGPGPGLRPRMREDPGLPRLGEVGEQTRHRCRAYPGLLMGPWPLWTLKSPVQRGRRSEMRGLPTRAIRERGPGPEK
ncbi:hypothetical protein NDU88_001565 [Pleurodeles waltl]|uniref:Uncharacterized protein n=1 Tax=Pleurodeles waltl TaxID=8319 RepID=A0AAV7MV07_PLEWA|nr:hypothetical protein NDU88_001565 [Pleurodeles waltl]